MKELFVGTIQYLAGQNLAFRGSNEKLFEKGNGNFLKLIGNIQNEIICPIGEKVRQNIIATLKLCR